METYNNKLTNYMPGKMPNSNYVDNGECSKVVSFEQNKKGQEEICLWSNNKKPDCFPNDGSQETFGKLFNSANCPEIDFIPKDKKDEAPLDKLWESF